MARWTLYNCLNEQCRESFSAFNNNLPTCPKCGSMKLMESGYGGFPEAGTRDNSMAHTSNSMLRRTDAVLEGLADSFGMTDINGGGGPSKVARQAPSQGKYGNMNIMGVNVPIDDTPVTVSGSTPYTPVSVKPQVKFSSTNQRIPTEVVARHK